MKKVRKRLSSFWSVAAVVVVIAVGIGLVLRGNKATEPSEHDQFAQCLYESGMRMYGSVTCSFCARQRELFGSSFKYIHEIECDPRNENNEAQRCIAKNISHTPTWILEDEAGNEVERLEPGLQPLEKLSQLSNCPLTEEG